MARFFLGRLTYESRVSSPLVKNYPSMRLSLTIEVYRGSTRIQESVGRQPASCLHSSITGCRENSPAYCSSSIQLFPLSVSRRGSIVNPNRQRFKPRFFFKLLPHRLPPSRAWCTEKIANSFVDLRQYLPDENWIRPKRPLFST